MASTVFLLLFASPQARETDISISSMVTETKKSLEERANTLSCLSLSGTNSTSSWSALRSHRFSVGPSS